ncbi:Gfo/Idh/MocA family oxidoreductase [Clostridium sp. YIM B02515]|uniref:Gfo/Idh/MocA family oxidoreductase n=1 Tax=Clostridium rhizosphaerae TaxID=2803861 RepID=A0ABS1TFG6_9CLOT|nr:Gfo/Idh/MocA family oxidoreductase [Clostridium rhizosphaerae]MBL4936713.1 Gfo/Idh/MocA family oxidoreductase [Clostridium rhizosphaerae]
MQTNEEKRKDINFAIVGLGGIGNTHAISAYMANMTLNLPYNLNLVKTVTRKPSGFSINGVTNTQSLEEVLEDKNIDFIDICTPNDSHGDIVRKAILYKKPVYCEKPLSSSYYEAVEMAEAVKEAGIKNAVALIYRFVPSISLIINEINEGTIGEIIDFKIKLYHKGYLNPNKKDVWRTSSASGGGALLDLGIHLVDIIQATLGNIEKVNCSSRIFFENRTNVDEISNCNLYLENGIRGNLEVSRIFADSEESTSFVIYGTKGSIRMSSHKADSIEIYDFNKNMTFIKSAKGMDKILRYYGPSAAGFFYDSHKAGLVNFANMISGINVDGNITADFEEAAKSQRVIEACYKSSRENREVNINEIKYR